MRIVDICSRRVICVDQAASIQAAAELMREQDVGALVVTRDGQRKPVGIITDRDVVMRVIGPGKNPRAMPVAEAMTATLATCRDTHELLDVMAMMREHGIRRVPVVDARSALVGIVSTDDVIGALAEHVVLLARSVLSEDALERRHYRDESGAAKNPPLRKAL